MGSLSRLPGRHRSRFILSIAAATGWVAFSLASAAAAEFWPSTSISPIFGFAQSAANGSIVLRTTAGAYVSMTITGSINVDRPGTLMDLVAGRPAITGTSSDASGNAVSGQVFVYTGAATPENAPPWFAQPVDTITQGTLSGISASAQGSSVQLSGASGPTNVPLPANLSVTVVSAASVSDLHDVSVRVLASLQSGGTLVAKQIDIMK